MNKPTCETCPYWERLQAYLDLYGQEKGRCRGEPPQMTSSSYSTRGSSAEPSRVCSETGNDKPVTDAYADWCGLHPGAKEWAEQEWRRLKDQEFLKQAGVDIAGDREQRGETL